jgi:hypothetical protein
MAKLINEVLPKPAPEYNRNIFNQLIKVLQTALGTRVHTTDEASETEAVNYFLSN